MSFIMDASKSVFAPHEVGDKAVELSRLLPLRPVSAFAEYVLTHVFQLIVNSPGTSANGNPPLCDKIVLKQIFSKLRRAAEKHRAEMITANAPTSCLFPSMPGLG
jgi:hypothetical protein